MSFLDALQVGKIKAELERVQREHETLSARFARGSEQYEQLRGEYKRVVGELDSLKRAAAENGLLKPVELKEKISELEEQLKTLARKGAEEKDRLEAARIDAAKAQEKRKQELDREIHELNSALQGKRALMVIVDEEILLQEFGLYTPRYDLQNSEMYKAKLHHTREVQKKLVKAGTAAVCASNWTVNNNEKEGQRMVKDYVKLILRAFNNECDASMIKVKFNNIDSIEKRIRKAYDTLNKLGQRMSISISTEYLNSKLEELYLLYEYEGKKQEEREEQRRIREQMREEAKVMREIEEMKEKAEKEERHFTNKLAAIEEQIHRPHSEAEHELLEKEKALVQEKLAEVEHAKEDIANRELNTRAGYVYIISNIGSFGNNVYKIGVTRRLEPTERVDELGDTSVPFGFDIHAMIFSDDAPSLENALHKAFANQRLNLINLRREFFKVNLDEIEHVVRTNFEKPVEFVRTAAAEQFRESELLRASRGAAAMAKPTVWNLGTTGSDKTNARN